MLKKQLQPFQVSSKNSVKITNNKFNLIDDAPTEVKVRALIAVLE